MPTSTRQILCEFVRADVGIRPYDAVFNTAINYNLNAKCIVQSAKLRVGKAHTQT